MPVIPVGPVKTSCGRKGVPLGPVGPFVPLIQMGGGVSGNGVFLKRL